MDDSKLTVQELEEKFETFLFNIDDYLDAIEAKAQAKGFNLDRTLNSLKDVEGYISEHNVTIDNDDYDRISAYLGEIVRKNFNGKWSCNLDKENNAVYYGFPVIEGHADHGVLFSPFHIVKAFMLRKKENLLMTAVQNQINPEKMNWSKFPNEE